MKRLFTLAVFLLSIGFAQAAHVDPGTAKLVGQRFLKQGTGLLDWQGYTDLELVYTATNESQPTDACFYVFNTVGVPGFVIVAADDAATPILGYSNTKEFRATGIPENVAQWLGYYTAQITAAVKRNATANTAVAAQWTALLDGEPMPKTRAAVAPLCQTTWDQTAYYNAMCPYDNAQSTNVLTGCVATAMAQVMKYWNHPATGTGEHGYYEDNYGYLSANFGATSYQWSAMNNVLWDYNNAVATLIYHCGVAIDMDYGVNVSLSYMGSYGGSQPVCAENALKYNFGYSSDLHQEYRDNYDTYNWNTLMKLEMNAGRPVIYSGSGTGIGHCFVCDGYDDNDFFHYNWGWGGSYDGFFVTDGLDPAGTGSGGGDGVYNGYQNVLIGIQPDGAVGPQPDPYEANNEVAQTYSLPVSFSNNVAEVTTPGSTCHIASDVDFYKVVLPAGYDYSIDARLHDSYASGNGQTYSLDARFSYYDFATASWTPFNDTYLPAPVYLSGAGEVYFYVEPFYAGNTGSYMLDIEITRSGGSALHAVDLKSLHVYPVPASDLLTVDLGQAGPLVKSVELVNALGQIVYNTEPNGLTNTLQVPVRDVTNGTYVLRLVTDNGIDTRRVAVQR